MKEAPDAKETANSRNLDPDSDWVVAQVLKNYFSPQGGQTVSDPGLARDPCRWHHLKSSPCGGVSIGYLGQQQQSLTQAAAGDIVALSRLDGVKTGDTLVVVDGTLQPELPKAQQLEPVYALAITPRDRKDEVKLSSAIGKLLEEDPSLSWEHRETTHEIVLWGQGDIHLQIATDRLARKHKVPLKTHTPHVPYKESIRKASSSHGRYKHQTGGHGQYGDVRLDIQPRDRGEGFSFNEKIVGGVVPRQYIPGVEMGVREFLQHGVLGFPIVDIAVTLTDGAYHSVDSSEQAFKQAARIAMQSGLPHCQPVLLEPIERVTISTPTEFTSKVLRLVSNHRGQVLGYEAKPDWESWDEVAAYLPMAEMQSLIIELRSLTQGVGFFNWQDDHLEVVPDKVAERVLARTGSEE